MRRFEDDIRQVLLEKFFAPGYAKDLAATIALARKELGDEAGYTAFKSWIMKRLAAGKMTPHD